MKLTWILLGVLIVGISIYLAIFLFFSFMSPLDKIESELLQKDGEVYVWIDLSFPSNPITLAKLEERGLEIRYNRYGSLTISGKTDVSKLLDIASVPEVVYIREVENYYFDVFDVSRASCYHDIDYVKEKLRVNYAHETGRGVVVAVIDSGVECDKLTYFTGTCDYWDCMSGTCRHVDSVDDVVGHGTAVAETMTAIAPNIEKIVVLQTSKRRSVPADAIVAAVDKAIELNVDLIQMSIGHTQTTREREERSSVNKAYRRAVASGIVASVSAGNSGPNKATQGCPACLPEVISSGALCTDDEVTSFSSRGPSVFGVTKPDVVTYGCVNNIGGVGMMPRNLCGTSFSSPQTSGVIALILEANPNLTPNEVRRALLSTTADLGVQCWDNIFGTGRVQADMAVMYAKNIVTSIVTKILNIFS